MVGVLNCSIWISPPDGVQHPPSPQTANRDKIDTPRCKRSSGGRRSYFAVEMGLTGGKYCFVHSQLLQDQSTWNKPIWVWLVDFCPIFLQSADSKWLWGRPIPIPKKRTRVGGFELNITNSSITCVDHTQELQDPLLQRYLRYHAKNKIHQFETIPVFQVQSLGLTGIISWHRRKRTIPLKDIKT